MLIKILLVVLSLILVGAGYILSFPQETIGQCLGRFVEFNGITECRPDHLTLGRILNNAGTYLFPIAVLLFFASKTIFENWSRFAIWFIPIATLLVILQPEKNVTLDPFLPGQVSATVWLGTIFLIISALIIFFSNRKKSS